MKNPFTTVTSVLGAVALVLIVVGLINGSEALFVALAVNTFVMWLASTAAHVVTRKPSAPPRTVRAT